MLQLKELRAKTNTTQLQIANYLGVSRPTYTRYESGEREPNIETIKNLSAYFNISLDELLVNDFPNNKDVSLNTQIIQKIKPLSDADKENLIRYIDFIQKRNTPDIIVK